MFNRPSDVSATGTDEEEALERRNGVMEDMRSGEEEDDDDDDDDYDESMGSTYSAEEERKVVRKFDWHLTLFMAGLYTLSFLDRSTDIGNAKVAGLETDLQLSSNQYEWALLAFYMTYITFEWMSLLYKVYPAHIYIALCVFFWGLSASLQSVVINLPGLITLRACLGIAEAAFGPGLPYYLSFFYKRNELALRTGLFISAAPLATSLAGSIAWLITSVTTSAQTTLAPWRALFLIEGFPSVFVAAFVWKYVPDRPGQAHYLSPRERKIAVLRLRKEKKAEEAAFRKRYDGVGNSGGNAGASSESKGIFNRTDVGRALKDPKAWLTAVS
ncbi:hypothetical protein KEM54_001779 [Ascosphaera aggregata]|nr:hypothetical protein KEM54_001779 [Ascosphaera aggregata]